jgi:hypothetical protein
MVNRRRITLTMVSRFCYWSLREGRNLESWNNGMLEFWVPSIHQCIIPLFQDSFEGGNPWLELCKTCA